MAIDIDVATALEMRDEGVPLIDVRSPSEYLRASIPGAHSIPLFSDEQRAQVGTIYTKQSKVKAVQKGLEFVGPKMKGFSDAALAFGKDKLIVHCWRGGMRSGAMAWLFETLGLECYKIKGGYKGYRNYLLSFLENPMKLVALAGRTGSGKTEVLHKLKLRGEQVLDLESLANHKGSAFGALGEMEQPTSEMFENRILDVLRKFDFSRPVWVEDESINIGRVFIPQPLWRQMASAPIVVISTDDSVRLKRIMRDYGSFHPEDLAPLILKIQKRMGYDKAKMAYETCLEGDVEGAARMCLAYYDKLYDKALDKVHKRKVFYVNSSEEDVAPIVEKIISLNIFDNGNK